MGGRRRVRAVVVDYDGGEMTVRCVDRLLEAGARGADLEVVVVDNGSDQPVLDQIAARHPDVRTIRSGVNLGFGGGCNLGMGDLSGIDFVALVNNDAEVSAGWLDPLIEALDEDARIGAVCPKMLFLGRFVDVDLVAPPRRRGRLDRRLVGVRLAGAEVGGDPCRPQLVSGFLGPEVDDHGEAFQWTSASAHLRMPVGENGDGWPRSCRIRLSADRPVPVELQTSGTKVTAVVGPGAEWIDLDLEGPGVDVINNVGSVLLADGHGADRGFLEPDDGRYDQATDVHAWCGGAVLLRTEYLRDIGRFDERLFLYYEDLELSLRGAARGWRYRYVPSSTVRHAHSATAIEGSPLALRQNDRNRLVVSLRHAPPATTADRVVGFLAATASYLWRDTVAPLADGRRPRAAVVNRRMAAFAGFVRLAPATVRSRRRDRRTPYPSA